MTEPEKSPAEALPATAEGSTDAQAPTASSTGSEASSAASPPAAGSEASSPSAVGSEADTPLAAGSEASSADSRTTDITAGQGGVMTDEVGVVTGDLTLRSELTSGEVTVKVQYKDADEWYAVTGAKATLKDPADLGAVHTIATGILNRPEG